MPATAVEPIVPALQLEPNEVRFYKDYGFLYLPGLLSEESARTLRDEVLDIMEVLRLTRERLAQSRGSADKLRQSSQYLRGSRLDAFVNSQNLRSIASQLVEGEAHVYLPFTAVKAGGGGGRFHFHQDNQYTRHEPGSGSINIWFALNDMTPENGCLQVVPRSHLHGTLDSTVSGDGDTHRKVVFEPEEFLPVRMRAGDAIAFSRLTVHGSGPNVTDEPRVAYAVQFYRNDVKWRDVHEDGSEEWHLLTEKPRFINQPVDQITPPKGDLDGH